MSLKNFTMLLLLAAFQNLSAQKIMIGDTEGNRLLQWNDFAGNPDDRSSYFAHTVWKTKMKYNSVKFEGDKAILEGFEMTLEFDPKGSWVKKGKETETLLKHEQGHFDVGLLYLQDVLRTVASASFTRSNYKEKIQRIVKDAYKKYVDMGNQYDTETNHSMKKEEQEKWNAFFSAQLKH